MATKPPKTDGRETRAIDGPVEVRAASAEASGPGTGVGYAVRYNSWADIGGGLWKERFAPGAFSASVASDDVLALHSHDTGRVVGRKGAGTLSLRDDAQGVAFENPLPDNSDGRDLTVSIDRGDIPGMSFGFVSRREEWNDATDPPERTIFEARLVEITYIAAPAYGDTSVGLRSLENARAETRKTHNNSGYLIRKARLDQKSRGINLPGE
jgi:HK97 family phage prohead protease